MKSEKKHEFRVIVERELPQEVLDEIELAIRSATLQNIARLDFSGELSVSRLLEEFDHTKGMILK